MKMEQVREIANAVLYEGYLLYPYRHSAIKNQQRWSFGVVYPQEYSEANGGVEPWMMQTECLLTGSADTLLDIHVRFLHLLQRTTIQPQPAIAPSQAQFAEDNPNEKSMAHRFMNDSWQEGVEREVSVPRLSLTDLVAHPRLVEITFPAERIVENPVEASSVTIFREQYPLAGAIIISAEFLNGGLFKLRIRIENRTPETAAVTNQQNAVALHSFASTHTIFQVYQGAFVSLMDPPEALRDAVRGCQNLHTWPVLVGNEGEHDALLSSPIILYDYPQIAPESPGALFDGTEIDEILTLRILTLSDEEKEEIRQGDVRAREILERTESLSSEQFMKLHGVIRGLRSIDEGGQA